MIACSWFTVLLYLFQLFLFINLSLQLSDKEPITYHVDFDTIKDTLAFIHIQVKS